MFDSPEDCYFGRRPNDSSVPFEPAAAIPRLLKANTTMYGTRPRNPQAPFTADTKETTMCKPEVASAATVALTDEQLGLVSVAGNPGLVLHTNPYADLFAPVGSETLVNASGRIAGLLAQTDL
jgi:hypothetical protein